LFIVPDDARKGKCVRNIKICSVDDIDESSFKKIIKQVVRWYKFLLDLC